MECRESLPLDPFKQTIRKISFFCCKPACYPPCVSAGLVFSLPANPVLDPSFLVRKKTGFGHQQTDTRRPPASPTAGAHLCPAALGRGGGVVGIGAPPGVCLRPAPRHAVLDDLPVHVNVQGHVWARAASEPNSFPPNGGKCTERKTFHKNEVKPWKRFTNTKCTNVSKFCPLMPFLRQNVIIRERWPLGHQTCLPPSGRLSADSAKSLACATKYVCFVGTNKLLENRVGQDLTPK